MIVDIRDSGGEGQRIEPRPHAGIAVVDVGTAPDCAISLPRGSYPGIGRRELRIVETANGVKLESLQQTSDVLLDGTRVSGLVSLSRGEHALVINDYAFTLTVD